MIYSRVPDTDHYLDFSTSWDSVNWLVKNAEGRWVIKNLTPAQESEYRVVMDSLLRGYIASSLVVVTDDLRLAAKNCYSYASNSDQAERPPDIFLYENVKEGTPHENYEERRKNGEILVSDYKRGTAIVRQTPGYTSDDISKGTLTSDFSTLIEQGVIVLHEDSKKFVVPGTNFTVSSDAIFVYGCTTSRAIGEWIFHPPLHPNVVLSALESSFDTQSNDVKSLVTQVLAKANRSAVDVLTAFAELPKSISSVIAGVKAVAGITRDLKKKQFNLSKASAKRSKQITKQYQRRIDRLNRELSSKKLSAKRRAALQDHLNVTRVKMRTALLGTSDELANALADVWLNYRYNIMPNVYLAQDIWEAVDKFGREFTTSRGTVRFNGSVQIFKTRLDVYHTIKCMVKRSFSDISASQGRSVISNDIFVTAWELVPLSFVYDWFINIGDLLSAQSYQKTWTQSGNTLSFKAQTDAEIDVDMPGKKFLIEPKTLVQGSLYKRIVINPIDHCGLVWQPSVGLERKLDATALAWRPVRSLLLKGKQR